jgi:indolepyruvate ferredoxin oxidoreductase, beta subunit
MKHASSAGLLTLEAAESAKPTNVLIVGTGGQGVILVSKILARICQLHDLQIKQSEVHGMAKRGGSVFSHVRFGREVWAPTIPAGEADVLVALEWAEGLRWLPYLNLQTGTFIADTKRIVPPFVCLDRRRGASTAYPDTAVAEIVAKVPRSFALDAEGIARKLGNERAANTILLGVLSTVLDFPVEEWQGVLTEFVPAKTLGINAQAFDAGRAWTLGARDLHTETSGTVHAERKARTVAETFPGPVSLEITEAWCKGCDICVKMCPERCLRLNDRQVVELSAADACTGCRICEWLCPDFAITVRTERAPERVA